MKTIELLSGSSSARLLPQAGGLLTSLRLALPNRSSQSIELLWLPSEFNSTGVEWPGGGMPICFPFAGRVWHEGVVGRYALGDQVYEMPLHGFSWQQAWSVESCNPQEGCARLVLGSNGETRKRYPFDFRLTADYRLAPSALTCCVLVENLGGAHGKTQTSSRMPVSLGFHPYFRMPLAEDSTSANCSMHCQAGETIEVTREGKAGLRHVCRASAISTSIEKKEYSNLILGRLAESGVQLDDSKAGLSVQLSWSPAERIRYLVLWRKEAASHYCVEPWMGLPDAVSSGDGLEMLESGEACQMEISIRLTSGIERR